MAFYAFQTIVEGHHSVMHSLLSEMPHHKKKQAVEKTLVDSGIPYVIIQPTVFMQRFTPALRRLLRLLPGRKITENVLTENSWKIPASATRFH